MTNRALAGLSIDLDDRWTYLRTRGDASWVSAASFLTTAIPRILDFLDERGLRATFFVVGRDAERREIGAALASLVGAGHEVGNHSYGHEPWLHQLDEASVRREIDRAEAAIADATGSRPIGFRGPGHSVDETVRSVLASRGYLYDASPLRTFVMPLVRRVYFRGVPLTPVQRRQRASLGGTVSSVFGPNRARLRRVGTADLVEIPVTTFPGVRLPIHFTYLQHLASVSDALARAYFASALAACRLARVQPCLLLHATDFIGAEDEPDMKFFPGMTLPTGLKLAMLSDCLEAVAAAHRLVPLRDFARELLRVERRRPTAPGEDMS